MYTPGCTICRLTSPAGADPPKLRGGTEITRRPGASSRNPASFGHAKQPSSAPVCPDRRPAPSDCLTAYSPRADDATFPHHILDDYAIALNVLVLAPRVPTSDFPALLAVGTRALLRVHRALHG